MAGSIQARPCWRRFIETPRALLGANRRSASAKSPIHLSAECAKSLGSRPDLSTPHFLWVRHKRLALDLHNGVILPIVYSDGIRRFSCPAHRSEEWFRFSEPDNAPAKKKSIAWIPKVVFTFGSDAPRR